MKSTFLAIAVLLTATLAVSAEETTETEYDDFFFSHRYERVTPHQPTSTGDKVEVLELFWYGCPHCNDFEPYIAKWHESMPDTVQFKRLPAVFRDSWVPHARAYFAAEILGVVDKIHLPMFNAMHKQHKKMESEAELAELFAKAGIDKEKFLSVYKSFTVQNKVRQATELSKKYGIRGVPAVIINGKYRTSAGTAGGYPNVIRVIDHLIAKEASPVATAEVAPK